MITKPNLVGSNTPFDRVSVIFNTARLLQAELSKISNELGTEHALRLKTQMSQLVAQIGVLPKLDASTTSTVRKVSTVSIDNVIDVLNANIEALIKMGEDKGEQISGYEIRNILRLYYALQKLRIQAGNRAKALERDQIPNAYMLAIVSSQEAQESAVMTIMASYIKRHPMTPWLSSVKGIGPTLTAGLESIFDITKAPYAGHFWSYAGYTATQGRKAGQKCDFNPLAKLTIYKATSQFALTAGRKLEDGTIDMTNAGYYGKLYRVRHQIEKDNNIPEFRGPAAAEILRTKKFERDTTAKECYQQGIFPPAHLDARARRWVGCIFLSHFHEKWYELHYNKAAPTPYAEAMLEHMHRIDTPYISYGGNAKILAPAITRDAKGKVKKQ